jgi:signal transduction histidine kinase
VGPRIPLSRQSLRPHLPRRTVRLRLTLLYGCLFLASGAALLTITYVLVRNALYGPVTTSNSSSQTFGGGIEHASGHSGLLTQQAADLHQLLIQSAIALGIMAVVALVLGWFVAGRVLRPIRTMTTTTRRISDRSLHERLALEGPPDELRDLGNTIDGLLERLETAFDSQRRFVANASHELRTPLSVSQTTLQVALADKSLTLDTLRSACEKVIASGKEQARLIDALLTLARSQRGLDHREVFDLAAVVRDALDDVSEAAATRDLMLLPTLDPAQALGDPRLVRTLIVNLVDNAIRYNRPCGRVEILTANFSGRALLRVSNTGPLVPDEQVNRLLQPFQRADDQRLRNRDGLGLGLSIVASIAAAHDATLSVHAQSTGGLAVEVAFPSTPKDS